MNVYSDFFSEYNYDVRESGDARWIDQKCTYDVLSIIADCICEYVDNTEYSEFTVSDIWHSDYARENVIEIFSKPDPELKAGNEYDKYFGQPIKLLGYSKVLNVDGQHAKSILGLAMAYKGKGDFDKALHDMQKYSHYDSSAEVINAINSLQSR